MAAWCMRGSVDHQPVASCTPSQLSCCSLILRVTSMHGHGQLDLRACPRLTEASGGRAVGAVETPAGVPRRAARAARGRARDGLDGRARRQRHAHAAGRRAGGESAGWPGGGSRLGSCSSASVQARWRGTTTPSVLSSSFSRDCRPDASSIFFERGETASLTARPAARAEGLGSSRTQPRS